jgi:hypothetical protein
MQSKMYSDQEIVRELNKLTWGTNQTGEDLLKILKASGNSWDKKSLYIKILTSFYWHKVRHIVPKAKLTELLADDVIRGVFPQPLREKYKYVRSLL